MAEQVFTTYRRDMIAKTWFDLLKVVIGAAIASKFLFGSLSFLIRCGMVTLGIGLCLAGVFICPKRRPGEGS